MTETTVKWTLTGVLAAIGVWLGILAIPIYLLLAAMVIDYITGLRAAKYRGEKISSYKGIRGIEKKVILLLLVFVGVLIDQLILYCTTTIGFDFPLKFAVAVVIAVWLTVNEIISILENTQDIGVELPSWLLPLIKNIKSKVESNAAPKFDKEDNDHE